MMDYTKAFSGPQRSYDEGLREYMLKVYNYMALALVISGAAAVSVISFPPLTHMMFQFNNGYFAGNTGLGNLVMWAPLGISLYFFMGFGKMSIDKARTLFWVYSVLTGMSLSSLAYIYTGESIARTFFICASVFGGMSLYGHNTKKDLTSMGSFMTMGLIGLVVASLANMFFQSPAIHFATSIIGIIIFMGLIAWDTQKLKSMYYTSRW